MGREKSFLSRKSLKNQILFAFCMVSIIPVIAIGIWSYANSMSILSSNMDELTNVNLNQTRKSVKASLDAYSDLLYQMYTNDSIVELTDLVNANDNPAVNKNRLRLELKAYAYAKPNIRSIAVITQNKEMVYYDMLTAASTKNSWMDNFNQSKEELFEKISDTNRKIIFPSRYASTVGTKPYYFFHMANRIIDYRNVDKRNGVVILSIDETVLNDACNQENSLNKDGTYTNINFIVDEFGRLVSYTDASRCGEKITNASDSDMEKIENYKEYARNSGVLTGEQLAVHSLYDEELKWTFVNISDQSMIFTAMREQQRVTFLIIAVSAVMLTLVILFISNHLTASIQKITKAMKLAGAGELSVQITRDKNMPEEIAVIAHQFNQMIEKVNESVKNEKQAFEKQKDAEISALEAQIDPHFIYNILDTVNWMAIDRDQYEISNTISSLGKILRYGINQSNHVVELREEIEWLKRYVFLQQTRMKDAFECRLHVEPNVLGYHIHKLLFQPFVENAIVHGFEGVKRRHILEIEIREEDTSILIKIVDNGCGMEGRIVEKFRNGQEIEAEESNHIGIRNAIGRLKMYYGEEAEAEISSVKGEGTVILIRIPKI